ncbi:MAG: hypothetical protein HYV07_33140 [Deltaproteobacteria bacterium]|nr:hypothetical protein [Deltaproteobacteria bacterium]
MPRWMLVIASMLVGSALGCADECSTPDDCKRDEVCYKSTCRSALYENLSCVSDDECGGNAAFVCVVGRCALNPISNSGLDAGTSTTTDAGP